MITKIKKINNFRVFQDYCWPSDLNPFKKYNVIFGWNGSGKTTLSDLFRQVELKTVDPDCADFEIQTTSCLINKQKIDESSLMIKVYNQDFRDKNISFTTCDANPIFFLGMNNIEIQAEIDKLRADLLSLISILNNKKETLKLNEKNLDTLSISQAYIIKTILHADGYCEYNSYHKGNFKRTAEKLENEDYEKKIVNEDKLSFLKNTISTDLKPIIQKINLFSIQYETIEKNVELLLNESIVAETIGRLKNNSELNSWVKSGLEIIKKEGNLTFCPFCEQENPSQLIEKLERHFSKEYDILIEKIDSLDLEIQLIKQNFSNPLPKPIEFYPEFSTEYDQIVSETQMELNDSSNFLDYLLQCLSEKKKNPYKKINVEKVKPRQNIQKRFEVINNLIEKHNAKTEHFNESIAIARSKIEEHLVAEKLNEYLRLSAEIALTSEEIEKKTEEVEAIKIKIDTLEINIIEHRRPAHEINNDIKRYLGRDEIKFSVKDNGYQITRYGKIAHALSEGEKTAITFIYFLKTLQENNFKIEDGIIVIDDPISSLDSNSLYNAFQFMKNRTKNSAQLIILTHNFLFFNEVKNWFGRLDHWKKQESDKKCFFYMLENSFTNGNRVSSLKCLDKLLRDYDSEYHYLFSKVYKNSKNEPESLETNYVFPNISRRLLESFLAFRVPSKHGLHPRLNEILFDDVRKDRIYRFVNDNSHSGYISGNAERDLSFLAETQQVSKDIMDLIENVDGNHFKEMIKVVS